MTLSEEMLARGKVRDIYEAGDDLLMVASDRISAFDVVLPTPIPGKGQVLTGSRCTGSRPTKDLVPNHLITRRPVEVPAPHSARPGRAGRPGDAGAAGGGRARRVRGPRLPHRGRAGRTTGGPAGVCGIQLPAGLVESERLPEPIFTPTTKAATGHDVPLTFEEMAELVGEGLADRLKELTLALYAFARRTRSAAGHHPRRHQVRVRLRRRRADPDRRGPDAGLVAVLAGGHGTTRAGGSRRSTSSTCGTGWTRAAGTTSRPRPSCPPTSSSRRPPRYREAYERITGEPFGDYLARMGAAS